MMRKRSGKNLVAQGLRLFFPCGPAPRIAQRHDTVEDEPARRDLDLSVDVTKLTLSIANRCIVSYLSLSRSLRGPGRVRGGGGSRLWWVGACRPSAEAAEAPRFLFDLRNLA